MALRYARRHWNRVEDNRIGRGARAVQATGMSRACTRYGEPERHRCRFASDHPSENRLLHRPSLCGIHRDSSTVGVRATRPGLADRGARLPTWVERSRSRAELHREPLSRSHDRVRCFGFASFSTHVAVWNRDDHDRFYRQLGVGGMLGRVTRWHRVGYPSAGPNASLGGVASRSCARLFNSHWISNWASSARTFSSSDSPLGLHFRRTSLDRLGIRDLRTQNLLATRVDSRDDIRNTTDLRGEVDVAARSHGHLKC